MRTRFRGRFMGVLAGFVALAVLAAACGDDGGAEAAGDDASTAANPLETVDRNAEFHFALNWGFTSLDPHRSPSSLFDQVFLVPVYDRLLKIFKGPDGGVELGPQLAKSFEVESDGLSVSFELRDDVVFQDGGRFNGEAVRANIERAKDAQSTVSTPLKAVERVEVVDDTHVVFRLSAPDASIPYLMAGSVGSMISPTALNNPDLATKPVGSGPFTLVSAQKDADVVYERWDGSWDKDAGLVQKVTISTVADPNARYNGVRAGSFDAANLVSPLDAEAESLESQGYHREIVYSSSPYGLLLNSNQPPLDDVRVRRAIYLAINRKAITEQVTAGLSQPQYQAFLPGYTGHVEELDEDPYDPEEARKLVQEAGAAGQTITIVAQQSPPSDSIAQVLQQELGDIGLKVELVPLGSTEARPGYLKGTYGGIVISITGGLEPSQAIASGYLGAFGTAAPPPPEIVTMANAAKTLPFGSKEREEAYQDISRWLVENPVHVPIMLLHSTILASPNVVGAEHLMVTSIAELDPRRVGIAK